MMFTPLEPNAGPIGGAGLAWPPLHCSFTKPEISFAIFKSFLVLTTFLYQVNTWSPKFINSAYAWTSADKERTNWGGEGKGKYWIEKDFRRETPDQPITP